MALSERDTFNSTLLMLQPQIDTALFLASLKREFSSLKPTYLLPYAVAFD